MDSKLQIDKDNHSLISISFNHQFTQQSLEVDFRFPNKGITALFGRSGSGKTTIAKVLSGLMTPDSGRIELNNQTLLDTTNKIDVPAWKRAFGVVFQEHRLFPHLSVKDNLLFSQQASTRKLVDISSLLGLDNLLQLKPSQLSGGEQQRVAIGRCLLSQPQLIIMDEPLSSLDLPRRSELIAYLKQLHHTLRIPVLYITHSINEIVQLADHMVVVDDGRVVSQGTPSEVISSSALSAWSEHASQSTLLVGQVDSEPNEHAFTQIRLTDSQGIWVNEPSLVKDKPARVRIEANNVSLSLDKPSRTSIRNILQGEVVQIVESDSSALIKLSLGDECSLWANISLWALDELNISMGQTVFAQVKALSVERYGVAAL
jgi:molybdate transport system ATP-binding protein